MNETRPYRNEATQSEKREVLKDTYFARQQNTADDAGGRFTKLTPTNVTGSTPVPSYPQQPTNSPWSSNPVPPEEPLGFSVDELLPNLGGQSNSPSSSTAPPSPVEQGEEGVLSSDGDANDK